MFSVRLYISLIAAFRILTASSFLKRISFTSCSSFGTSIKTASGSKTVRVGSKNTTSAKTEKPLENPANKKVAAAMLGAKKSEDAQRAAMKKGHLTGAEAQILQKRRKTRRPVI